VALAAGLGIAFFIMSRDHGSKAPPPASRGGLIVETARPKDEKLDMSRPLRCFVNGQMVGELTLADCAQRNGVATGSLDVGLDESGAIHFAGRLPGGDQDAHEDIVAGGLRLLVR